MNDFTIKGCLVKDHINKRSYNLTSKIDAVKLHETLTTYENEIKTLKTIQQNFNETNKQLTQIFKTLVGIQTDIETLNNKLKEREVKK